MAPVGIGKWAKLTTVYKRFDALLNVLKIIGAAPGSIADIVRKLGGFGWIGRQGTYNIDPIKRVQMIEMNDMVVLELSAVQQVSDQACVFGDLDPHCIFDCPHRGQSMGVRSDAAGALDEMMRISGVTPLQYQLDAPEHLA